MAIKIAAIALKRRVGRVSGNTGFFLGLNKEQIGTLEHLMYI